MSTIKELVQTKISKELPDGLKLQQLPMLSERDFLVKQALLSVRTDQVKIAIKQ
jgi:hypothetical protein